MLPVISYLVEVGIVYYTKASANYVPAAAVRRRMRALPGIIGRKACVGGYVRLFLKPLA